MSRVSVKLHRDESGPERRTAASRAAGAADRPAGAVRRAPRVGQARREQQEQGPHGDRVDARWRGQHRRHRGAACWAAGSLFDDTRAPSTVGSWLRAHKWSNARQHDAISRELLARLWAAGAGPDDLSAPLTFDLDSSIVPVFGRSKQGAAFGYTQVRGYPRSSQPARRPGWCCSAGCAVALPVRPRARGTS